MRVIADLEKKIIDRICEGHTHIRTLLIDHIPNLLLQVVKDRINNIYTVDLLFKSGTPIDQVPEKATFQTEKIIYIIKFLLYLEKEGYALTGYFSHGRAVDPLIGLSETIAEYKANNNYMNWSFTDERMLKFIFDYTDITIFPTHQLKAFKQNKYRTQEDVRHKEIMTVTWVTIFITLIIGMVSIIIGTLSIIQNMGFALWD
jgi:hypothetical protein